ncbi:unnamed protein product [Rhizophagus irregularis]|nr:unnamed protein product [Rhizophagus irregularis]
MRYLIFCALCFLFAYNKSGSHLPKLGNTFPIYDFFVLLSDIETDRDESRVEMFFDEGKHFAQKDMFKYFQGALLSWIVRMFVRRDDIRTCDICYVLLRIIRYYLNNVYTSVSLLVWIVMVLIGCFHGSLNLGACLYLL